MRSTPLLFNKYLTDWILFRVSEDTEFNFLYSSAGKKGKKRNVIIVRPDEDESNSESSRDQKQVRGTQRSEIAKVENQGKCLK